LRSVEAVLVGQQLWEFNLTVRGYCGIVLAPNISIQQARTDMEASRRSIWGCLGFLLAGLCQEKRRAPNLGEEIRVYSHFLTKIWYWVVFSLAKTREYGYLCIIEIYGLV